MTPTKQYLDLPDSTDEHFVHVISNLFTTDECEQLIAGHSTDLTRINATYTTRLREIYDDDDLAKLLWDRLQPFYGTMEIVDEEGQAWIASHLNNRFRFCKYLPGESRRQMDLESSADMVRFCAEGDAFGAHIDGRRLARPDSQSFMTVNMYLNDVPESYGGATRVLEPSSANSEKDHTHKVLGKMQPTLGSAAIFRDSLFHDGEPLKEGVKYLLRTDVMFERKTAFDFECMYGSWDAEARGGKALDLARRLEDGGNRDEAVHYYRRAFRLWPQLEKDA